MGVYRVSGSGAATAADAMANAQSHSAPGAILRCLRCSVTQINRY